MKTILASTYAVNPFKGSEDGMGWNFILQIARYHQVIAITRENNRMHIEKYMQEFPKEIYQNIQFEYYDLPAWMRGWKKGSRGAMLYYILWQWGMVSFIRKNKLQFDVVHNLNFHNDWTPSFLWKLKRPFVWGPVGHHPLIPRKYLSSYSNSYWIKDRLVWMVKNYFWKISPSLRRTKKRASHILCMNSGAQKKIGMNHKCSIMPSVATEDYGFREKIGSEKFLVISAGRLIPLKGFDLTIKSFALFLNTLKEEERIHCELHLIGSGPEEVHYKELVDRLGIKAHIQFIDWIDRSELMLRYQEASAFLFPSHEGAGMVVAEALSFGLPVICLQNEGPGEFIDATCGFAIPRNNYQTLITEISHALQTLYHSTDKRKEMSDRARQRFLTHFHWNNRGEQLKKIYASL